MKLSKKLSALPFAHLLGIGAARADDDEESKSKAKKAEDDDEEDKKDAKKAEGDDGDDEKEDKDAKKAKKAEDGGDPDKDDEKKGRKSKKAEDDEDDEGDKEKAARTSERARCAAIFRCASAGNRPDLAAHMAFNTGMNSADAIAMLDAAAAGSPKLSPLASRMNSVKTQNPGADDVAPPAASSAQGVANRIIAAGKARRGEA